MNFPNACQFLEENLNVDDVLSGGTTVEEVSRMQEGLIMVLNKGAIEQLKTF